MVDIVDIIEQRYHIGMHLTPVGSHHTPLLTLFPLSSPYIQYIIE
jgi:hypothetical protein